ncbi:MAG: putative dioxygenase [Enterovirga sp.]|jgi:catechol 2,3-dioxygenase-like lactoylglutathione lyase family enzyme|nr:putative dioxygenase [Enterovirga sp.]
MRLDHVTILTNDVAASSAFLRDALGLEPGPRPPFSFDGAWLYAGATALVHLKAPNRLPADAEGPLEHVAFRTEDFDRAVGRLDALGIERRLGRLPDGSLRQCFFREPNGALIEITGP